MAESELKLELPCPRCGTSNLPTAQRCRQCFNDFESVAPDRMAVGGLFDFPKAIVACEACGHSNAFNAESCGSCGIAIIGAMTPERAPQLLEGPLAPTRLRNAVKARRKMSTSSANPSWVNLAWLLRLSSVLFLFWGVIDTSIWLSNATRGMAASDPAGIRYSVFAIYELVRNMCILAGVWLLTFLRPRRT